MSDIACYAKLREISLGMYALADRIGEALPKAEAHELADDLRRVLDQIGDLRAGSPWSEQARRAARGRAEG